MTQGGNSADPHTEFSHPGTAAPTQAVPTGTAATQPMTTGIAATGIETPGERELFYQLVSGYMANPAFDITVGVSDAILDFAKELAGRMIKRYPH